MRSDPAAVRFRDRAQAGRVLATKLARYVHRPDVIVLALPRGGVPPAITWKVLSYSLRHTSHWAMRAPSSAGRTAPSFAM